MSRKIIDFVERNIHGAWVVWGDLGIRQYYGYTKKESMKKYRQVAGNGRSFHLSGGQIT